GCLNRGVSEQKLNLFQLASSDMTEPRIAVTQIMWGKVEYSSLFGGGSDDVSNGLRGDPVAPDLPILVNSPKDYSVRDEAPGDTFVERGLCPAWNRYRSDALPLAQQIRNCPMIFPDLQVCDR